MKHLNVRIAKSVCLLLAIAGMFAFAQAAWEGEVRLTDAPSDKSTNSSGSRAICAHEDVVNAVWWCNRYGNFDLFLRRSVDGGATWQPEVRLVADTIHYSERPAIANSGNLVAVAWEDNRDDNAEIYCKVSQDGGGAWGNDLRLTVDEFGSYTPCVAVTGSHVHVVWQDDRDGGEPAIYYKRSDDAGGNWTSDLRIDPRTEGAGPAVISARDTIVHVVWTSFDYENLVYVTIYTRSTDGGNTWSAVRRIVPENTTQLFPTIAVWGTQLHLTWLDTRNNGGIYHQRSDDDGATWSAAQRVSAGEFTMTIPAIAVWGQSVHIAWMDSRNSNNDIYYQYSPDGGMTWYGEDYLLTPEDNEQAFVSLATAGTKVHAVWSDSRHGLMETYYRRNPTGSGIVESPRPVFGMRELRLWPNPFVRAASVPGREADLFDAYDLAGQRIGTYRGAAIGADLRPGVYFIRDRARTTEARIVKTH